jgi:D-3-phosphoglycerate dehydrogenase/C-terminal binding protein
MSRRAKIVITDFATEPLDCERRIVGDLADIVALGAHHESNLPAASRTRTQVMIYHCLAVSERTINSLEHCRLIVRCGVGFDNVDREAARRRGIPVANVPDYGTEDVADSALGMALALSRGVNLLNSRLRGARGPWSYTQGCALAAIARPDVWHHRYRSHRHSHGAPREGLRNERCLLRSLRARWS